MKFITKFLSAIAVLLIFQNTIIASNDLEAEGVLTLLEEVRIPARDAGVLAKLAVRPGMHVTNDMLLAELDNTEARVARDQAATELENSKRLASNDLKVQLAQKTHEVAAAELTRATDAAERFSKSVSKSEIDRLRLAAEQAELQINQARFDLNTARLAVDSYESALQLADHKLSKRAISAPSPGVVVEVLKHAGEWVEPGETVLRIVRMDRLRVESFLPATAADAQLVGKPASVTVQTGPQTELKVSGEITFVSPEIHPVNGMVRVWIEIENRDSTFRPGLSAAIKIAR